MNNQLEEILNLKKQYPKNWAILITRFKKYQHLKKWIDEKTPLLNDKKYNLITKLYWIIHDLHEFQRCKFCNDTILYKNVDSFEDGYFRACSIKCKGMQKEKTIKYKKTMIDAYGVDNFFLTENGKKLKQEWLQKNNIENAFQLESVKIKSCQTRKQNFGYEYTMQSPEKRNIASERYKIKTGYSHQFKDPTVKQKSLNTSMKKKIDGIDIYTKRRIRNREKRYELFLKNNEVNPNFTKEDFIRLDAKTQYITPLSWHCKKCNRDFTSIIDKNFSSRESIPVRCYHCHPITVGTSKDENELYAFIKQLDENVKHNYKALISPYEIDVYSSKNKLAFEYDGLYWHSEYNGKTKFYHLMKTEECKKKGIQLIHIFEDEWLYKKDIVKSRIKNLFDCYDKKLYARKCQVKEVTSKDSRDFQDKNHLQGSVNASINIGLFYNDELVSLMTFGKCRFDKKHEWEMLRFCNKCGYHIQGGASKLLKHFEKIYKPKSLVSYADRRWSQGKLYKELNFTLINVSSPNYWYITNNSQYRFSRIQFQKHKLKNMLKIFDESMSEIENMKNNGYYRIFDCGNYVFEKIYS